MKKISILFLCVIMLCCMTVTALASSGRLKVETVAAKPGEGVDVNIMVEANPGIIATLLSVEYDASALTLTGVDNGTIFPDEAQQLGKEIEYVPFTILWEDGLSAENHADDGVLATLHFTVKENAADGEYEVKILLDERSTFNVNLENVNFSIKNGCVRIGHVGSTQTTAIISGTCVFIVCVAVVVIIFVKKRSKKEAAE